MIHIAIIQHMRLERNVEMAITPSFDSICICQLKEKKKHIYMYGCVFESIEDEHGQRNMSRLK